MRNLIEFCACKTTVNERISDKIPSFTVFLCRKIITIIESKDIRFYQRSGWGGEILSAALRSINGEIRVDLKPFNTFGEIKSQLESKLQKIDNYALGTLVILDIGDKQLSNKQVLEIEDILLDHGLHLKRTRSDEPPAEQEPDDYPFGYMPPYSDTTLICKHLRSGQKVFCEGNLVILGDINPGAEVVAGGNIVVMGTLKGMAHAGAFGDDTAVISAYRLSPTQIRIANHITRPPDGEVIVVSTPETARIRAGKVVIEKLKI